MTFLPDVGKMRVSHFAHPIPGDALPDRPTSAGHVGLSERLRQRYAATLVQGFNLRGQRSAPVNKLRRLCGTVPAGQAQRPRGYDDVDAMRCTTTNNENNVMWAGGLTPSQSLLKKRL